MRPQTPVRANPSDDSQRSSRLSSLDRFAPSRCHSSSSSNTNGIWTPKVSPDAIRLRAPIRMASGRQKSPPRGGLEVVWVVFGEALGRFWLWGSSGDALGRLWESFGEALWRLWGGFGKLWGAFGEALGGFGDALEGFGEALGGCAETLGKH